MRILKTIYASDPFSRRTRTLLTVHNLAYQGKFPKATLPKISLSTRGLNPGQLELSGKLNFLKAGLVFADGINRFFRGLQQKFPDYVSVKIMYHDGLAHKVEAGADLFLMPSRYEPCGLNQRIKS